MQPKYRGNGTPERTGSLSFSDPPFRVDVDAWTTLSLPATATPARRVPHQTGPAPGHIGLRRSPNPSAPYPIGKFPTTCLRTGIGRNRRGIHPGMV